MKQVKINLIVFVVVVVPLQAMKGSSSLVSNTGKLVNTLDQLQEQLPPPLPPRRHGPKPLPREPRIPPRKYNSLQQVDDFLKTWRLRRKIAPQELVTSVETVRANLEGILNWFKSPAGKRQLGGMSGQDPYLFRQMVRASMDNIKKVFSGSAYSEIQGLADEIIKVAQA